MKKYTQKLISIKFFHNILSIFSKQVLDKKTNDIYIILKSSSFLFNLQLWIIPSCFIHASLRFGMSLVCQ